MTLPLFALPATWETDLLRDLAPLIPFPAGVAIHLAVMVQPYVGRVERGEKTIESRWSMDERTPWRRVQAGDVVVFKPSGGPVLGWALVERVDFHQLGEGRAALVIAAHPGLGVDAGFVELVKDKRRVSLIHLGQYHRVEAEHIRCGKRDQRGWVVLRKRGAT